MVKPVSQAAGESGSQEEAELQSSNHMVDPRSSASLSLHSVHALSSIDMLMLDQPAEQLE